MKELLKKIFSADSPVSSMRIAMMISVFAAVLVAIGGTAAVLILRLDSGYLGGIAGIVGALLVNTISKAIQSFSENKGGPPEIKNG